MEPPAVAPRRIDFRDPRVKQASLQRHYLAPAAANVGIGEAEALDVLAEILGVGPTSRLYRALVVAQGIASSAGAYFSSDGLDYGRFAVYGTPRPGTTLEALEVGIDSVIADLLANGVTQEELERAKTNLIADTVYARDNQQALAQAYGVGLTTGLTVDEITAYPDRVATVAVDDVLAAAHRVLEGPAHVTGYLRSPEEPS
jgi:zinc protease